jgi:hypothetical protein
MQGGGGDTATLANILGMGIEAAKRKRIVIIRAVKRKMIHPSLTKLYKRNHRQLWYHRLPVTMFTDTMYSTIFSRQGNKAAQVFCTDFGFVSAFPMKKESKAHDVLSLLFHKDDVPNVMVMDGAKSQVEGEFRRKPCDAGWHIKQTEPHIQSSNKGEGGVRELKRGVGRQIIRSACPKQLWDDCIIREAYVRSHTSIDIFGVGGKVPERKVKGETVDISTIAEYAWYEWVKFWDTAAKFPVSKIQIGRDLGAATVIGPAVAHMILKKNGQVMYRISVRSLTPDKIQSPEVAWIMPLKRNIDFQWMKLISKMTSSLGSCSFLAFNDWSDQIDHDSQHWHIVCRDFIKMTVAHENRKREKDGIDHDVVAVEKCSLALKQIKEGNIWVQLTSLTAGLQCAC